MDFHRGTFRVHGDVLEIFPAERVEMAIRVEFFGDEIDRIAEIDVLTGEMQQQPGTYRYLSGIALCSAAGKDQDRPVMHIEEELEERVRYFKSEDKLLEAQRISERTNFDIEMLKETGFCSGIENYSRHLCRAASREQRRIH